MLIYFAGQQGRVPLAPPSHRAQAELRAAAAERRRQTNEAADAAAALPPTRPSEAMAPYVNPYLFSSRNLLTVIYSTKR